MPTESHGPTDPVERRDTTGPELESPSTAEESAAPGGSGRWLLAAVVVVLVVYPAARWVLSRGGTPSQPAANTGQAQLQLSFQHYQAKRYEEAVTAAKAAIAANSNSADAYNNMAVSYLGLRRYDEAIDAAQNAIRLRPDYQLATNNLAWILQERTKAVAPSVPPAQASQAAALLNQSLAHAQARRFQECVDTAMQATKLDPGSARAFNNLGFCDANLKQWDEAIRSTQEAIRLDPTLQIARNNLAWMQQEKAKAK